MAKLTVEVTEKGISQTERKLKGLTSTGKTASNQFSVLGKNALASAASITTIAASFGSLAVAIKAGVSNLSDYEVNLKRTEAILTATGNAAGFTAEQLQAQAEALALNTLTGVENVQKAQAALLTFNRVSGDVFTEAIELSQDLAEAGFGSIESNAVQLGKALQDPITGISALTRVGVTFNDTQKETIRLAQQSGDTLAAQTIIINALTEQVGGAGATVANDSLAGKIDTAGQLWDDFTRNLATSTGAFSAAKGGVDLVIGALNTLNDALEGPSLEEQIASAETSYQVINQQIDDQIAKVQELNEKREQGFGYLTGDYDLRQQINNAEANLAKLEDERVRRAETLGNLQSQQSEQVKAEEEARLQGLKKQKELEDQATADREKKESEAIAKQQQREQDAIDLRVQALQQRYQSEFELLEQQIALVDQSTLNEIEKLEVIDNLYDEYFEKQIAMQDEINNKRLEGSQQWTENELNAINTINAATGALSSSISSGITSLIDGSRSAKEVALDLITSITDSVIKSGVDILVQKFITDGILKAANLQAVTSEVAQNTALAAQGAFAATAAIPIVGPALAPAAATAAATAAGVIGAPAIVAAGARAQGGQVQGGQIYEVGERGREFYVPESNGRIYTEQQMGSGTNASGGNVTINNYSTAQVSAEQDDLGNTYVRIEDFSGLMASEGSNPDSEFNQAQDRVYTRQRA